MDSFHKEISAKMEQECSKGYSVPGTAHRKPVEPAGRMSCGGRWRKRKKGLFTG